MRKINLLAIVLLACAVAGFGQVTPELFLGAARAYPPPGSGSPVFFFDGTRLTQSASVVTSTGPANSYSYPEYIPRTNAAFVLNGDTYVFNILNFGTGYFKVFKWNGRDLLEVASLQLPNRPVSMAVSRDAKRAYVGINTAGGPQFDEIRVVDLTNPAAPALTGQVLPYSGLVMDIRPQGDILLIRAFSSVYAVTTAGQIVWFQPAPALQSTMLCIEPTQGNIAYIADDRGNLIKLTGIGTRRPVSLTITGPGLPFFAYDGVFHPSGKWLYVSTWPAGVYAVSFVLKVDTANNTASQTGSGPTLAHYGVTLNAAKNRVYLTGANNSDFLLTYSIDNVTGDLAFTSSFNFPVNNVVHTFALAAPMPAQIATRAYVADTVSHSVTVIDTGTNALVGTIRVGAHPIHLAVLPNGSRAYVANANSHNVSVIDPATNTVVATIPVGANPVYVAAAPNGASVYVVNSGSGSVSVIDTATNLVVATINVGLSPERIAITANGTHAYVTNKGSNNVSVIDTATHNVVATVMVGSGPAEIVIH